MLQEEHSAILSIFIKLPFVIKIFDLSNFEWLFYTGFTVCINLIAFLNLCSLRYQLLIFQQCMYINYYSCIVCIAVRGHCQMNEKPCLDREVHMLQ